MCTTTSAGTTVMHTRLACCTKRAAQTDPAPRTTQQLSKHAAQPAGLAPIARGRRVHVWRAGRLARKGAPQHRARLRAGQAYAASSRERV